LVTTRSAALAAVGACALAVTGTAQAAKKTVFMGIPPANQKTFEDLRSDVNAFFPSKIKIHQGDTVAFAPVGFHNLDLPAKGGTPTPLAAPSGTKVAGVNDAAGNPFWFNGQDDIQFALPLVTTNNYGKSFSYNGKKGIQSGLPLGRSSSR